jgi:hypothetical protein
VAIDDREDLTDIKLVIDDEPMTMEPKTAVRRGESPAEHEPSSITLEPNMSVRSIDAGVIARMQRVLETEEDPTTDVKMPAATTPDDDGDSISIEPRRVTRPKSRKMTLVGVGDRGPALPTEEPEPQTQPAITEPVRTVKDTVPELATEKRKPLLLEKPITLTDSIEIPIRQQRDTDLMTPEIATEPPRAPAPRAAVSKPPLPAAGSAPSRPPRPTERMSPPPPVEAPPPSSRGRIEIDSAPPPRLLETDDSAARSYRGVFASSPSEASPQNRKTAIALAASFVLAGALASGIVIWQAYGKPHHTVATTTPSATPPPAQPSAAPAPPEEPAASADPAPSTSVASRSPPRKTVQPARPPPRPVQTARPTPPKPPPAPKSTKFDPGAI